jgi:hypothetical protein
VVHCSDTVIDHGRCIIIDALGDAADGHLINATC